MADFGKEPVWAVVELFGHLRHAGLVQEDELFGQRFGRVEVPDAKHPGQTLATHFFAGSAVFRFTPCSEAQAREQAARDQGVWSYAPALPAASDEPNHDDRDDGNDTEEGDF